MKGFLKHTAILIIAFLGIATLVSIGSLWALRKSSFYKPSFLANGVSENNFDYIVLGSSTGLTTLNTKLIDSLEGMRGLNLSMDDTGMSSQYLMLEHFLAEGKKTKYCILAPGIAALENKNASSGDNDYRFLMFVNRDYVYDYYKNSGHKTSATKVMAVTKWVPFVGVSYYNTELFFPSLAALIQPEKRNRFDNRGNYTYPKRNKKFTDKDYKIKHVSFDHPYLTKIEALCKANNIQLVYYFSPMRQERIEFAYPAFPVIDHTDILLEAGYFYDEIHVNTLGRQKVSESFAKQFSAITKEK